MFLSLIPKLIAYCRCYEPCSYARAPPTFLAVVKRAGRHLPLRRKERVTISNACRLREQFARIGRLDEEVVAIERRLRDWYRQNDACRRLAQRLPGVGLLTATVVVAAVGDELAASSLARASAFS